MLKEGSLQEEIKILIQKGESKVLRETYERIRIEILKRVESTCKNSFNIVFTIKVINEHVEIRVDTTYIDQAICKPVYIV